MSPGVPALVSENWFWFPGTLREAQNQEAFVFSEPLRGRGGGGQGTQVPVHGLGHAPVTGRAWASPGLSV